MKLWPMWVILASVVVMFSADWQNDLPRHEPVSERNMPRVFGWIPEGVELRQTECGYCFVRPAETIE